MSEEGVETGGKAGMSRKLVVGIIVAIVVAAGIGAAIWWDMQDNGTYSSYDLTLYFDTQYSDSEWTITLVNITTNTGNYYADSNSTKYSTATFFPSPTDPNAELILDTNTINNIRTAESPLGVRWHDVGNDNVMKVGDYLTVNRSGGAVGKLEANYYIDFITDYSHSRLHLPPAEFLEMDVAKTATGWNMTVTWANETIPNEFMMWPYLPDQIEDLTGNVITVIVGPVNHPYQQIWHDRDNNNFISEGDVIEIINSDGKIESGYIYRLMNNKYGYRHTIMEVVLI